MNIGQVAQMAWDEGGLLVGRVWCASCKPSRDVGAVQLSSVGLVLRAPQPNDAPIPDEMRGEILNLTHMAGQRVPFVTQGVNFHLMIAKDARPIAVRCPKHGDAELTQTDIIRRVQQKNGREPARISVHRRTL